MAKRGKGWPVTNFTMYEDLVAILQRNYSIIRLFNFLASNFIVDTIFFLLLLFFEILVPIILHFYYSLKKELKEKMELREILYINGIIVY